MAKVAIKNGPGGGGNLCSERPPILRRSCSPESAWITLPAPRKRRAFEEGVGHQMENASGEGADTKSKKHVAKLADGGIGEDFFDVVLHQRDGGGENGGEGADDGHDVHGDGGKLIDGVDAR